MAETWTIVRLLTSMQKFLQDKQVDSPRLDAEVLLSHVLGQSRIYLYTHYDQPITDRERDAVRALCKRRAVHEPIAYIVGSKEFYGLDLQVTHDVLIPRPETEQLVDIALAYLQEDIRRDKPCRVLDIGTGSGAIAIALAHHNPNVHVVGLDISAKALAVAQANVVTHQLSERIVLVHAAANSLLQDKAPQPIQSHEPFDLILSNPPYIGLDEKADLARSVIAFEPHQALFSGLDGFDVIDEVIRIAERCLRQDGMLAMEIAPRHASSLSRRSVAHRSIEICPDLAGHARVAVARAR